MVNFDSALDLNLDLNLPTRPPEQQEHHSLNLKVLEEEIKQHQKYLDSRSYLARGVAKMAELLGTDEKDSMKRLQELDRFAKKETFDNNYQIDSLNESITKAIKEDQTELKVSAEISRYGGELFKVGSLFLSGKLGWIAAGLFYSADHANPRDSIGIQIADASLGALQGIASKGVVTGIGSQPWNFATKGVVMGISNRLIDGGLDRRTYADQDGSFSISSGLAKLGATTFNPAALTTDVAVFGAGVGLGSLVGKLAPSLAQSPLYSTVATGGAFGIASGAIGEVNREITNHEPVSLSKILARSAADGIVSSIAAIPGGLQAQSQYQSLLKEMQIVEVQPISLSTTVSHLLTHDRVQAEQLQKASDMPGEDGSPIHAQPGDWKVTDAHNHTYAVPNDIFTKRYGFTGDGIYIGDEPVRAEQLTRTKLMRNILDEMTLAYPGNRKITTADGSSYVVQHDFRMDYSYTGKGVYAPIVTSQEIPAGTILKTSADGEVVAQLGDRLITAEDGTQTRVPLDKIDTRYDWLSYIKKDPTIPQQTLGDLPPQLMPPLNSGELHGWPAARAFIKQYVDISF